MIENGLDYDKTVETGRLVFEGQRFHKINSYIFLIIIIGIGIFVSYNIFILQMRNNPSIFDYFISLFVPLIITMMIFRAFKIILNRDKLKRIDVNDDLALARIKFLKAAENLKWETEIITENYIIIRTKYGFVKDCQTITLIIFPDQKIYFNSINYPNDYIRPARFADNYQSLIDEYSKI